MTARLRIAVFGLGHVGLTTAAGLASMGHSVIGTDVREDVVAAVKEGHSPISDVELEELVRRSTCDRALAATGDVAACGGADVYIVCVDAPTRPDGSQDLDALQGALRQVASLVPTSTGVPTVVTRTTMLPGTSRAIAIPVLELSLIHI